MMGSMVVMMTWLTLANGVDPNHATAMSRGKAVQAILAEAVARNHGFGGGILRMQRTSGEVLWEGAAGLRQHGGSAPIAVDDHFEIASITKVFTAVLVLQLVEEGKLDLDAPLAKVAPSGLVNEHVTARQLLGHTSGLPDYWSDPPYVEERTNAFLKAFNADANRLWQPRELLTAAGRLDRVGAAGAQFHYCDTGYVILGLVIEHLTHKPFDAVLQERIFTPLGLTHTFMKHYDKPTGAHASHRYEEEADLSIDKRQSADWAGGGIVSTTADLARFMTALAAGKMFLDRHTLALMQTWRPVGEKDVSYGLGLYRIGFDDGVGGLWGHDGHGNSFMYFWPEENIVVVGTLNQTQNDWWPLVSKALDHL